MNLTRINARVDRALAANRRAEYLVIAMASGIFSIGCIVIVLAYFIVNPYVMTGGFLAQGFLYWPIRQVMRLRQDNLVIQTFPDLVSNLPPDKLAEEITKFLEYLRRIR